MPTTSVGSGRITSVTDSPAVVLKVVVPAFVGTPERTLPSHVSPAGAVLYLTSEFHGSPDRQSATPTYPVVTA